MPNDAVSFSEALFGIDTSSETADTIVKRISDLQKELVGLYAKLNNTKNKRPRIIDQTRLDGYKHRYPFIENINLDPDLFSDAGMYEFIQYFNMPFRVHMAKYMSTIPNAATVFHSLPIYHYVMHLSRSSVYWTSHNSLFLSPHSDIARLYQGQLTNGLMIRAASSIRKETLWEDEAPAMSLQCLRPVHISEMTLTEVDAMQIHPHANTTAIPFTDVCTGSTNPFRSDWEGHKIKSPADFDLFVYNATRWVRSMNICDCYTTNVAPITQGIAHAISDAIFDIALDIVRDLSIPLLNAVYKTYDNADKALRTNFAGSLSPMLLTEQTYGPDKVGLVALLAGFLYRVENDTSPIISGNPYKLASFVKDSGYSPANTYQFVDTCHVVLKRCLKYALKPDNGESSSRNQFNLLLMLREAAYAMVLLRIVSSTYNIKLLGLTGKNVDHFHRINLAGLFRHQISVTLPLLQDSYQDTLSEFNKFMDFGYKECAEMRSRLLAPRVLYEIAKTYGVQQAAPAGSDRERIHNALKLTGFTPEHYR